MRFILFSALMAVCMIFLGCNPLKSTAPTNSNSENSQEALPADFIGFEFYYSTPALGTYDIEILPQENSTRLIFNSSHNSIVTADKMLDKAFYSEILALLEKYNIYSWDNFKSQSEREVLESDRFSLAIYYNQGKMILADGADSFPENFHEFYEDLHELTLTAATNVEEETPLKDGVDYSLYSALLGLKNSEYNELSTQLSFEYEETKLDEVYGSVYANLIDIDNNGILELVLVNAHKGELTYDNRFDYSGEHIEIYTISDNNELVTIGKLPLLLINSPFSSSAREYAVNYAFLDGVGYIATGKDSGDTSKQYYRYTPHGLELEITLEAMLIPGFGTDFSIDGKSVQIEQFKEKYDTYQKNAITHSLSVIPQNKVDWVREINAKTADFLANYKGQ